MATTTERGYGYAHKKAREKWKPIVEAGEATCCRCGEPIAPSAKWDLDHNDDRTGYRGAAHRGCNRRTISHLKDRIAAVDDSYDWFD